MNAIEKIMFHELVEQLEASKTALRAARDIAFKHNETMIVPFINDALRHIDSKIERAYEFVINK